MMILAYARRTLMCRVQNGDLYQEMWQDAMTSTANWILICTFNEWHEGTEIEPSIEFGDLYLNITHQYTVQWKTGWNS